MAKKVRKPRASNPRTYSESSGASAAVPVQAPAGATSTATRSARSAPENATPKQVDLAAEYSSVGGDLRRLLLTAGIMFAVLIAVNFAITLIR